MSLSMFMKPLVRLGVRLWPRPRSSTKLGSTCMISLGVLPLSPSTSSAARPLVSCESESAVKYTSPSSILGTTHTWLTHPGTLFSSTRSASSKPFSFAAKNSSCLYRCIASGTIWNAPTIFLRLAGRFSVSAAATVRREVAARTVARLEAVPREKTARRATAGLAERW